MSRKTCCALLSLFILFCITSTFSSCNVTKRLPEGSYLLQKNKFIIKGDLKPGEKQLLKEDLAGIAGQKPNKKFLFMPVRMWFYHAATKGKLTKFKNWVIEKVGEAPVIIDTAQTEKSLDMFHNYLFNNSFFDNQVTDSILIKHKKATAVYHIETGKPWTFSAVELPNGKTEYDSLVRDRRKTTFLVKGERCSMANLNKERERIDTILRNNGYYYFNREYVAFSLDSDATSKTVKIKTIINEPQDEDEHKKYRINNIYIITDYFSESLFDTIPRDTVGKNEFFFVSHKLNYKKSVLRDAIYFNQNDLYSKESDSKTITRLSLMGTFKFVSIEYVKADRNDNYLDCYIYLTPAKKQSFTGTFETNVTNEGLFGLAGSLSYKNKNLSKRADQFITDVAAGVQLRFNNNKQEKVQVITTTASAKTTYYLNKFLVPFRNKLFSRNVNPRTRISASYNFENRNDFNTSSEVVFLYQLHNFNFSFGYEWYKEHPTIRHLLNLININFFLLPKRGEKFLERLSNNPTLASSYQEQIIIGPNYSFTFSNQGQGFDRTYMYLQTNLETAGNVIYGGFRLANLNKPAEEYTIAKRPFAQFFKIDVDWRNYFRMNRHSMFAIRTFAGIGVPYGNSKALPFVKQYFVGGPNSLRGFLIREIGPGGYADTTYNRETGNSTNVGFFNQTGDIKIEMNVEFRFDIYKWFKGAVFADAGNVWLMKKDTRQYGEFNFNRFWSEFAVDAGAGVRLDFNYFVIRLDYGFPLRDPRRVEGKRWQFQDGYAFKNGQFQLAIGYPF